MLSVFIAVKAAHLVRCSRVKRGNESKVVLLWTSIMNKHLLIHFIIISMDLRET